MQLQRNVRVFCRVKTRGINIYLVETNLFCALAGDFFKAHGFVVKVTAGQRIHAVRFMGFQHIRLQAGIVGYALQADAVIGQYMRIVF